MKILKKIVVDLFNVKKHVLEYNSTQLQFTNKSMQKKFVLFDHKYHRRSKRFILAATVVIIIYFLSKFIQEHELYTSEVLTIFFFAIILAICIIISIFFLYQSHRNMIYKMVKKILFFLIFINFH